MSQTGADFIAETLHAAGVKRIYGVVGDLLNGITDSLAQAKGDRLGPHAPRGGRRPSPPAPRRISPASSPSAPAAADRATCT